MRAWTSTSDGLVFALYNIEVFGFHTLSISIRPDLTLFCHSLPIVSEGIDWKRRPDDNFNRLV